MLSLGSSRRRNRSRRRRNRSRRRRGRRPLLLLVHSQRLVHSLVHSRRLVHSRLLGPRLEDLKELACLSVTASVDTPSDSAKDDFCAVFHMSIRDSRVGRDL